MLQRWCGYRYCDCGLNEGINSTTPSLVGESPSRWWQTIRGTWLVGTNELRCRQNGRKVLKTNGWWGREGSEGGVLYRLDGGGYHSERCKGYLSHSPPDQTAHTGKQAPQVPTRQARMGQCNLEQYPLERTEVGVPVSWTTETSQDIKEYAWMAQHW
jgi:hypothetical protein